jgi:hypothetical protein
MAALVREAHLVAPFLVVAALAASLVFLAAYRRHGHDADELAGTASPPRGATPGRSADSAG